MKVQFRMTKDSELILAYVIIISYLRIVQIKHHDYGNN